MNIQVCPKCDKPTIMIDGQMTSGEGGGVVFVPHHARAFRWKSGVRLSSGFQACLACGHLWASVAPGELRDFLGTYGTELAKQSLQALESGPGHDLPDTPEARGAAERVAEIDRLILGGDRSGATRRFRERMATTWDKAIDAINHWNDLDRPQRVSRKSAGPENGDWLRSYPAGACPHFQAERPREGGTGTGRVQPEPVPVPEASPFSTPSQKLARCGWRPKEKPGETEHPMSDRSLDG